MGNQPPPHVDQHKLKEISSDLADEASERGSDTSNVQLILEGQEQRKGQKRVSGPKNLPGYVAETECGEQPSAVASA